MTSKKTLVLSEIYDAVYPVTVNFLGDEYSGKAHLFKSGRFMLEEYKKEAQKLTDEADSLKGKTDKESVKKQQELIEQITEIFNDVDLRLLAESYVSLDVSLSSNGEPMPITVENLRRLPAELLEAMREALKDGKEQQKKMKSSK